MSLRPATLQPVAPATDLLRNRPGSSAIPNPISLANPVLPAIPGALAGFSPADIPGALPLDLEAFRAKMQTASELALVQEVNNSSNKGLYFRSSANRSAAAKSAGVYIAGMAKVVGGVNDVIRQAGLVGAKYATADYEVAVKRYTAQVNGVVDRYEANADAFVQAQNIIYGADVTAIKLQDLGVEKAIGIESGYITDIRKTESQVFLGEVNRLEGVASREVGARSQIRISEMRQLGSHGYTLYEHTQNNKARAYENVVVSGAEYSNAQEMYDAKILASESAAEERKTGAIKVSMARLDSLKTTTLEKGVQQVKKDSAETSTYKIESKTSEDSIRAKYVAQAAAAGVISAGEIAKIRAINSNMTTNKTAEYAESAASLATRSNARIEALGTSLASRVSINPERLAAVVDGYNLNVQARITAATTEADAQRDAIPIITKAVTDVAVENATWAGKVFDKVLENVKDNLGLTYSADKENSGKESAANVKATEDIGGAEKGAASDRAAASIAATGARNEASLETIRDINQKTLDLVVKKLSLANELLGKEYGVVESVTTSLNENRLAVEAAGAQASLDAKEVTDSLDLATLKGLNDARLTGRRSVITARLDFQEKENIAKIKASGAQAEAAIRAQVSASNAAIYASVRSNEGRRIETINSAIAAAHQTAASIRTTIRGSQSNIATEYWKTAKTQDQRRDIHTWVEE